MSTLNRTPFSHANWNDTDYLVQATDTERFFLWQQFARESDGHKLEGVDWKQVPEGVCWMVGSCDERPVNVCLSWARLNGRLVCFYEPISRVVDWNLVDEWIGLNFQKGHCNAMNFHACLQFVRNGR